MRTIRSLQAGRGLAALAVVIHHSALAAHDFGRPFLAFQVARYGYLGVDFFFVLSGFIIYHSTVDRGRTIREYTLARFRRVYLPYWPVGLAIALLYLGLPMLSAGHRSWEWLPTLTLLPVDANPALPVAWTLKHEILFYLAFGLFYFSDLLWLGLSVWILGIIAGLPHLPFEPINLEFFFGIAACEVYRKERAHSAFVLLAIPSLLLAYYTKDRVFVGLAFAFLIAPCSQMERLEHFAVPSWLVLLGAASYSIYLVHNPVVSVAARMSHNPYAILAAGVLAGVAAGFIYHFLVETKVVKAKWNPEVFRGLIRARRAI